MNKKEYKIKITETYSKVVTVFATDLENALDKVGEQHENGNINLMGDYDFYKGVDFTEYN